MKRLILCAAIVCSVVLAISPVLCRAGLYDDADKNKEIKGGDLNDQDYWWAKFDADMLERAIKTHQPEGHIAVDLASSIRRLDDLSKKFPNHEGIKKWKDRADEVNKKIDSNADRGTSFNSECPWDEANFAQLWVNFHWGKKALEDKDYHTAASCLSNVEQNYEIMLRPDRMKNYPEDLRKWVTDSKDEADKMYKEAKEKS